MWHNARLECGRSWVRAPVGVKPKTINLVFIASSLGSLEKKEQRLVGSESE